MRKLFIVSGIFVVALVVLVWVGVAGASMPVLTVSQIDTPSYTGGKVQLDGGKVARIDSYTPLVFAVAPEGDPSRLVLVRSKSIAPENFKEGSKVSLRGEYDRKSREFTAYKISTQCPSRYEATKEAESAGAAYGEPGGKAAGTGGGAAGPGANEGSDAWRS